MTGVPDNEMCDDIFQITLSGLCQTIGDIQEVWNDGGGIQVKPDQ